jgi:hypothetical protein
MQLVTTTNRRRDEMSKKLTRTVLAIFAFATAGVVSANGANNNTPASPGACNMVNANTNGMSGMMNDPHVYDIMIPLVVASESAAACTPVNVR